MSNAKKRDRRDKAQHRKRSRPAQTQREAFPRPLVCGAIVLIFSFLLYANTIGNDFVWDDRELIVENPRITRLDGETVRRIFTENFWKEEERLKGYYRPLVSLSYHIDYKLFGMNPAGFHASNVLANSLACTAAFCFLYIVLGSLPVALISALIFAAFPLHTENVAWIAGRTDLLATLWMLVSLALFAAARKRGSISLFALSLLSGACAFFSKEIAIALPVVIIALSLFDPKQPREARRKGNVKPDGKTKKGSRGSSRLVAIMGPVLFLAMAAAYLFTRKAVLGTGFSTYTPFASGPGSVAALALSIVAGYAWKTIFPFAPNAEYDAPVPESLLDPSALTGLFVVTALVYVIYRYRRRKEYVLAAIVFLAGIAPVVNIVPLGEISAERFLYFPSLGFAIALGTYVALVIFSGAHRTRTAAKPAIALVAVLLVAYSARTVARNGDWQNEQVLFTKTARAAPDNPRVHLNLGNAYRRQGRTTLAIEEYKQALRLFPGYFRALNNLAGLYMSRGRLGEAASLIARALEQEPNNPELHANMGIILIEQKRYPEAVSELEEAVSHAPQNPKALFALGLAYQAIEEEDKALDCFEKTKSQGDSYLRAYLYIGMIEARRGNRARARSNLEQFLSKYHNRDTYRERAEKLLKNVTQGN